MKVSTKNIALILIFCGLIGGLIGCKGSTGNKFEAGKGNYPPAPPALMQAELSKLDGTTFKLENYKGKVILVNVWATWCGPCRHEIPELIKLQKAHQSKAFSLLGALL